ncbi:MAG: ATP-binding cassette domain-containing protein [Opitutales bacterium]|nr:ATP-binding cassette domain-containing protein [Opitutales bacterium]MCH8540752.1 ATP-binding cassette domain-containing protein [Opitutales bacterium]
MSKEILPQNELIRVGGLTKDFGPFRAVNAVSFGVRKGEILGFLGPNGAGKSTTMKILTGFIPATAGEAWVEGFSVQKDSLETRRRIGYLPESSPAYPEMTVEEFLLFVAECRRINPRKNRQKRVEEILSLCFLQDVRKQTIDTLSKGYKQRVGFAQAVIHDPPVLVLDEPTDGLDPNQKQEVRKIITGMAKEKAIILSTHILEEVEALCSRLIIIDRGKILVDETPAEFRQRHEQHNRFRIGIEGIEISEAAAKLKKQDFAGSVATEGQTLLVKAPGRESIESALLKFCQQEQWSLKSFRKESGRLDEVFRQLTNPQA